MIRAVHLHCPKASFEAAQGIALLTRLEDDRYKAIDLTIGSGGDFRGPIVAAASLRLGHGFDLIHAWDAPSFFAGVASGVPVIYSPPEMIKPGSWSWLATTAYPDVQVVSSSQWACARQMRVGLASERCHTILPALIPSSASAANSRCLRREMGIAEDEFVVLAPGESTHAANHRMSWHATAILAALNPKCRLMIWGRGREARIVRDLSARGKQPDLVIDVERRLGRSVEFDELIPSADVALVTAGPDVSFLPIAACAASALPIIAIDLPVIREILGTKAVSLVTPGDVRTLSQRLLELQENPSLRTTLGTAAAAVARAKFDPERFVKEQISLSQRLLGIPSDDSLASPSSSQEPAPAH